MKRIGNIFITALCCALAAVSFNSCIEEEDYTIDAQTYKEYMNKMAGDYSGKVRFYYPKYNNGSLAAVKYDSLTTHWTVRTDSTVTLYNFPISKLDSAIIVPETDVTDRGKWLMALRSQMKSQADITLKSFFYIPNTQAITSEQVQFYVNPMYAGVKFDYEGTTKTAYFIFYSNSYYGVWNSEDHTFQYQMSLYAICFDQLEVNSENTVTAAPYMRTIGITCEAK